MGVAAWKKILAMILVTTILWNTVEFPVMANEKGVILENCITPSVPSKKQNICEESINRERVTESAREETRSEYFDKSVLLLFAA